MTNFLTCKDGISEYSLYSKNINNNEVDFSFIVGAYNASSSIEESIQSLLDQDYPSFEIIIVDDGSTDNTFELIFSLYQQVNNIVLIKQDNIGLTSSLNRCIDVANGKYIARHDADDISYSNRLATLKKYFDEGETFLMSFADVGYFDSTTKQAPRRIYFNQNYLIPESLIFGNPFVHGTFAFTKEFISKYKYNDSFRLAQDFELLLRVFKNKEKIRLVPFSLYNFVQSNNSVSYKRSNEQIKLAKDALLLNGFKSNFLIAEKNKFLQVILKAYRELYFYYKGHFND
jgi:glycosyltransferase involved in cell wall biosynthesis